MAARTRLTLAAATADAVTFLFLASVWLTFGATTISHLGRVACGKGCRVVAAASAVHRVAFFPFLFLCPVALLFTVRVARSPPETEKNIAEALRQVLRKGNPAAPIVLGAITLLPFLVLMYLGDVAEKNTPQRERICSLSSAVGTLAADAVFCFLFHPTITRLMWRTMSWVR